MTYKELIDAVKFNTQTKEETVRKIIEETFAAIAIALERGDRVQIPYFGVFYTKKRNPRTIINPRTKKEVKIPAKTVPHFAPSKALKQKVEKHKF